MSSRSLTPVSYLVLGLIARDGPLTPYQVKAAMARGIAHFWPFPHSQIYSETEYLTSVGLLAEDREHSGRRRRTFRLTPPGRQALESWLGEPTSEEFHIRSYAFLKLYFGYFARPEDVRNLARAQIAAIEGDRQEIGQMIERLSVREDRKWQKTLAEMYLDLTLALLGGWKRVASRASQQLRASAVPGPGRRTPAAAAVSNRPRRKAR